ncbi:MAG: hypothetical protein JRD92_07680 [Deltaproteobacteria bacterium]|nr:hypothetical protein [Deltaproteobacteria bacterium]
MIQPVESEGVGRRHVDPAVVDEDECQHVDQVANDPVILQSRKVLLKLGGRAVQPRRVEIQIEVGVIVENPVAILVEPDRVAVL